MVNFGNFTPSIDLENIVKLDKETVTKALISAGVTYMGINSIIESKTPAQVRDLIDDIVTAKLGQPLGEMVGSGLVPDIIGVGAMSYFEIGDMIADAVVRTTGEGDAEALTDGSKSAAKLVLAGVVGGVQLINKKAIGGN
jgi:hypothetical protein